MCLVGEKFFHLSENPENFTMKEICRDLSSGVENHLMKMNVNLVWRISIIYATPTEKLISMLVRTSTEAEYDEFTSNFYDIA